jgi:hypothetical protein
MLYHNMSKSELIREAEATDNALALALLETCEAEAEEAREEIEEILDEAVDAFASRIEEALDEYNRDYYLNPESDHTNAIVECIMDGIDSEAVQRVIDDAEEARDNPWRRSCPFTEETMDYLLTLSDNDKEELADHLLSTEGFKVEINHGLGAVNYSLASTPIGELEEDLEAHPLVEDLPECIRDRVLAKVTGAEGGTVYYFYNVYDTVDLIADFDAIEEWVQDRLEEQAA